MKNLMQLILIFSALIAFATTAHARTIFWEDPNNFDTQNWVVEVDEISENVAHEWDFWGGRYTQLVTRLDPDFIRDPENPEAYLYGYVDSTIISNEIQIPEGENLRFGFVGGSYYLTRMYNGYESYIEDDIFTFGVVLDDDTRVTLGEDTGEYPGDLVYDLKGVSAPITELVPADRTLRFWWRAELRGFNTTLLKWVWEHCFLDDCPTQETWQNHEDVIDGWFELRDVYDERGYTEAVTCIEPERADSYLRGLKLRARSSDPIVWFRGVVFLPDNLPDQAPNAFAEHHVDHSAQFLPGEQEVTTDFVCDEIAIDPISVNEYLCVGIFVDDSLAGDLGGSREAQVPYQNVGAGNSRSYIRSINPSYPEENTGWTWMDDKEFVFSAVMDVDCDGAPTTTTSTSTT
ncbi:hypothetical protein KDL45_10695, partial [bacterium]|nr:hypothetical protein [bacterium]